MLSVIPLTNRHEANHPTRPSVTKARSKPIAPSIVVVIDPWLIPPIISQMPSKQAAINIATHNTWKRGDRIDRMPSMYTARQAKHEICEARLINDLGHVRPLSLLPELCFLSKSMLRPINHCWYQTGPAAVYLHLRIYTLTAFATAAGTPRTWPRARRSASRAPSDCGARPTGPSAGRKAAQAEAQVAAEGAVPQSATPGNCGPATWHRSGQPCAASSHS